MTFNGYHFTGSRLRDGSPIPPIGETLVYEGEIGLCVSGYHGSRTPWEALKYAPDSLLHRVHDGTPLASVIEGDDKYVSTHRTIVATIDATDLMRKFARLCALDVVHLWDAPEVVLEYLKTGDESIRSSARSAAWDASAWAAPRNASWYAARAVVWAANGNLRAYERTTAKDAAREAARAVEKTAERYAVWSAARDAQRDRFNTMVDEEFALKGVTHD